MVLTINQQENALQLSNRMVALYEHLRGRDMEAADKILQLGRKLTANEFAIAMCGHFSAGKSTLINTILDAKILPSSPIPTSANLVKVRSGDGYAKVYFKNERPRLYLEPYDYEMVKSFCKDGDQIQEIEISHSNTILPTNTMILDTPGIDSADDAHRIATESAIHLADIVLYVMDYNHVQSELNFLFTQELSSAGKELYLVINQIDKHKEEELSFVDFQQSVVNSFASWGVKPKRIFYTSLKDVNHPSNEFTQLQEMIQSRLKNKDASLVESVRSSLQKVVEDYIDQEKDKVFSKVSDQQKQLNNLPHYDPSRIHEELKQWNLKMQKVQNLLNSTEKEFTSEIEKILNNAYLMPFSIRSLAESYLESCQPGFKVGLLFSKGKTAAERNVRLEKFYNELNEIVKSQMEWHLKDYLRNLSKNLEMNDEFISEEIQLYHVPFKEEMIEESVKSGALLSGEYLLNYTDEIATKIKKLAKNNLEKFKELFFDSLTNKVNQKIVKLEEEGKHLSEAALILNRTAEMDTEFQAVVANLEALLAERVDLNKDLSIFQQSGEEVDIIQPLQSIKKGKDITITEEKFQISNTEVVNEEEANLDETIVERLFSSAKLIQSLPGFEKTAIDLKVKAENIQNKGFTVALFGAFSAGKSSFANALIGDAVLPVSPNPTTAAINKIKPVTDINPHGTVLVKIKNQKMILDDVNRVLFHFDVSISSLEEASKVIQRMLSEPNLDDPLKRTHYSFLSAFEKGFEVFNTQLGKQIETDISEFGDYVANEEKSCFVESIELYYDCELTRKGITLVDTPGADSINARHTGVAFDYIKNSDAILFVTYYNHAFSRADREFLIQLGRVKDSFQLDKMFFIINAIDLAEDDEEKNLVISYVEDQLVKYGIRKPSLYPLSSLEALKEKQNGEVSGVMAEFEKSFNRFISHDLMAMTVTAAENELNRVYERITKFIDASDASKEAKQQKKLQLEREKEDICKIIVNQNVNNLSTRVNQEAEELIFYIKQRVFLRFSDFFKEAFNPSVLKEDGRNLKKALQTSLEDLLNSIGFDFSQEMRATTLRLDHFAIKVMNEFLSFIEMETRKVNENLSFSDHEWSNKEALDFTTAFDDIDKQIFTKAMSYFKNPKNFFEKNEKKLMSEEIYAVLQPKADEYLAKESLRIREFYEVIMKSAVETLLNDLLAQTDDYFKGILTMLSDDAAIDEMKQIQKELERNILRGKI